MPGVRGPLQDRSKPKASSTHLPLPPEVRDWLGLAKSESARILDMGVRTILLERISDSHSTALPWDRDLVLCCDVRSFPLADILGLVHSAQKSGFLFFSHRDHAKAVYLRRGEVTFAASNLRVDRIGECLLRAGVINLEQLREAERRHVASDRFGKVLVERGFLTPRELWHSVKYQVEEIVRSLFAYTTGTVYFWEGEVAPDNVVRLSLPTRRLVSEGTQRRVELMKFLTMLRDSSVRIEPLEVSTNNLAGSEREMLEALHQEPTFAAASRRVGLDPLSAARTVQLLRLVGALKITRKPDSAGYLGEDDLRGASEARIRECASIYAKLLAELVAPMIAVEGSRPVAERFGRLVEEAAARSPALLRDLPISPSATLDPEELIRRTLALPGDGLTQLCEALVGLVAYLEFEIANHPRIADPDAFLASVEPLRARIDEIV